MRLNLEPYLDKKKKVSEIEKQFIRNDDNEIIKKIRPINSNSISKIPSNNLSNFIDDLNQKANKILNSSIINNKFEERLFKKQKIKLNKEKQNSKNSKNFLNPSNSLYIKREKALMLKSIKRNISDYKNERKQKFINLKEKNKKFRKRYKSCSQIQFENYYKPMNEQRVNDFSRILKKCMSDIIIRKENFKLPQIKLNINDVYSRLYHNEVFLKKIKQKNMNLNPKKNDNKIKNKNNNLNKSFDENENKNIYYNFRNFQVKNIIQNSNGKEFTIKITPEIKKKCLFNYSGGPKKNIINDNININNEKEKQYLITLETLNDENGNNNLQIAVKKHLADFVNYFLDKKIDINYQNKFGDTALHIAMNEKDIQIIKLLLNHNADLLIKNKEGKTPFDIATVKIRKKLNLESIILEKLNE